MIKYSNSYNILIINKFWNFIKIETSRVLSYLLKRSVVWGKPYIISIEPCSICDLRCPECPTGAGIIKRGDPNLDLRVYNDLIDSIKSTAFHILLYFQGEPLMSNNIFRMIKYAKERKLYTITSTNGQRLNNVTSGEIIESGLDRIIISLDGTDQLTYEKYRTGGDFNKVLEGVKALWRLKEERKTIRPEIVFQFLVFRHNESQVESFRQFGRKHGADKVWIKSAQIISSKDIQNHDRFLGLIPANSAYSRYEYDSETGIKLKSPIRNRCARLWRTCVITSDGDVVPCCFDKEPKYKMGSLKDSPLSEIWKNDRYQEFRRRVLSDRKEIDICNNCSEGVKVYF